MYYFFKHMSVAKLLRITFPSEFKSNIFWVGYRPTEQALRLTIWIYTGII